MFWKRVLMILCRGMPKIRCNMLTSHTHTHARTHKGTNPRIHPYTPTHTRKYDTLISTAATYVTWQIVCAPHNNKTIQRQQQQEQRPQNRCIKLAPVRQPIRFVTTTTAEAKCRCCCIAAIWQDTCLRRARCIPLECAQIHWEFH